MDEIDKAQEAEQRDRDLALHALHLRIAASFAPRNAAIDSTCLDCAQPIEPERIAAMRGCCSRCIECAQAYELRVRGFSNA